MADTPGDGGLDICLVSPSDQAGQINNLLDRVHNLEVIVSQLAGLDVTASNASDMVQSLGTITNGTLVLPDNSVTGWTNSIPPGDFSGTIISNGVITTWDNGVVSFEVQPSGITTGGGGVSSYLVVQPAATALSSGLPDISTVVFSSGTAFGTSNLSTGQIDIQSSGYYHVSVHLACQFTTASNYKSMTVNVVRLPSPGVIISVKDALVYASATDTSNREYLQVDYGFEAVSGDYVIISLANVTALSGSYYNYSVVTIEKLD